MVEETNEEGVQKKRGPRGGIRHTPGRGRATKSQPATKRRLGKRLRQKHKAKKEQARKEWEEYDKLPPEIRRLLGPRGEPNYRGQEMKSKSTSDRGKFADASEQMSRLYDRLVYWLYERQDARRARPFADRMEKLLAKNDPGAGAIFAEECRSLVHEAEGDLANAIKHRENEIRLIRRLHQISQNTPDARYVFGQYEYSDLSDRLDLLAMLYHDSGDLAKAISTLQESTQLCQKHGVKFDSEALLRDYQNENRKNKGKNKGDVAPFGSGKGRA